MADRWAVATGTWSNTATWNGGTLPGAGDDVFAEGRTITIDQNITVLSLRTSARSGGTAGGSFTMFAGTIHTVNGNVIAGTTDCFSCNLANVDLTINGNVQGGTSTGAEGVVLSGSNARLQVNGSVTGGSGSSAHGVTMAANSGVYTITGTVTGGFASTSRGMSITGGTGTLNGNLVGTAAAAFVCSNGFHTLNVELSVTGINTAMQCTNGTVEVFLTGNIIGVNTSGLINVSGGLVRCSGGNVLGGEFGNQIGIVVVSGLLEFNGDALAGANSVAILSNSMSSQVKINGNISNVGSGASAVEIRTGSCYVNGNVSGGIINPGLISAPTGFNQVEIVVHGNVFGGTVPNGGAGIGALGFGRANIKVFGSTTDSVGLAISNTTSGTTVVVPVGGGGGPSSSILSHGLSF